MVRLSFALAVLVLGCEAAAPPVVAVAPLGVVAPVAVGTAPPTPSAVPSDPFAVGAAVEVEWRGRWWPATVLGHDPRGWRIHYDGYDDSWDEVVDSARIREPRADGRSNDSVED